MVYNLNMWNIIPLFRMCVLHVLPERVSAERPTRLTREENTARCKYKFNVYYRFLYYLSKKILPGVSTNLVFITVFYTIYLRKYCLV